MNKQQRTVFGLIALVGAAIFTLFIFPNMTGARDANMLAIFEVDEFAQYPNVIRMLTPGDTPYLTLRNFLIYLHYFYGYPFYFFSALAILPVKLLLGSGWEQHTVAIVTVLRQMINVFPMLLAAGLLVYIQTGFRSVWRSLGLFVLLMSVPVVTVNNQWWHPDSLVFIFIALTFFFLDRDNLRFGRNFLLAAVACGLATGTKHLGLFFGLAIPVYLVWGVVGKHITWKRGLGMAAAFVGVMVAAVIASNPLLLLPMERAEIIATQKWQFEQTSVGIILANKNPYFQWGVYPEDFRVHYGELFFVVLALAALVIGMIRPQKRVLHVMILAWAIPFVYTVTNMGTQRTHYLLPVMLPIFSTLVNWFPERPQPGRTGWRAWLWRWAPWLAGALILVQFAIFLRTDARVYTSQLTREQDSPSIVFYDKLEEAVFTPLKERKLVIYRDWHIYVPEATAGRVEMNWDFPNYAYIDDLNPDLILLERENLLLFSKPETVQEAVDPGDMQLIHEFYADAQADRLPGYHLLLSDSFGSVFVKDALYQQYFAGQ
ncbi:MAG: hypothetical protein VB089_01970 [Anaerolineaceae bacterium]|nr:hypothetical protein [Anaerolineaceae bacterium]